MAKIYHGHDDLSSIPDISIGSYLHDTLRKYGNKIALTCGLSGEKVSYDQLVNQCLRLAAGFHNFGIKEGDVIAIVSENSIEYHPVVLATFFLNATIAPVNTAYKEVELEHCLSISKPRLVVCSPLVVSRVEPVVRQMVASNKLPSEACCVVTGREDVSGVVSSIHQLTADVVSTEGFPKLVDQALDKTSFIMCSSGTTGLPKGVEITDRNIITPIIFYKMYPDFLNVSNKDIVLYVLPFSHIFAMETSLTILSKGASIVLLPKFEPQPFLAALQNYKITVAFLVPPLVSFLSIHPLVDEYDLSNLREIRCGGAALSKKALHAIHTRLGRNLIRQGYGLTETSSGITLMPPQSTKYGSSGKIIHGMMAKVIDCQTGEVLGPGKTGELCFRGNKIMKGYKNNSKATEEMVDKEGWLHTGDLGYFDEDEFLFVVDRIKELIKVKGFQVAPAELEALLLTHPDIQDSAVIGIPDERAGELPLAFVVLKTGAELTEKQVFDFVANQVSAPKHLHGGVKFLSAIPKSSTGKVLRKNLRAII